jgi:hypothetical protein
VSPVLFLFLTHLAVGIAFTLLLVSREAGVKFFRFNAGLALTLLVIGLALGPSPRAPHTLVRITMASFAVTTAALGVYWGVIGRVLPRWRQPLVWVATTAGTAGIVCQALWMPEGFGRTQQILTGASFLTSAALLGGACTAMILGHWYLVLPSMDVAHLQRIVRFHLVSLVVRVILVGVVVWLAIDAERAFSRYIVSVAGVFFWQRVLFGLAAPGLLGWLTWETAKIRSTQSATGILYVDFFTVIVGEVLAKYLLLVTSVPV